MLFPGILQENKAVAVIIAASQGQDVTLINCKEEECAWPLAIPATMVGHQAGLDILVSSQNLDSSCWA